MGLLPNPHNFPQISPHNCYCSHSLQVFVQNNQPEQWQTMIESIYEAIERPTASVANIRHSALQSVQPIRARTATLGAPLANSEQPMDRIARHLGNMGI